MPRINLTRISDTYGGVNLGNKFDDLKAILLAFKDNEIIKKISIKRIEIRSWDVIDSLKFIYNVETENGSSEFPGGSNGGNGGALNTIVLDPTRGERILEIFGRIGEYCGEAIKNLQLKVLKRDSVNALVASVYSFGEDNGNDKSFVLSEGVIFGSSDSFLRSLGTYEIAEIQIGIPNP